MGNYAQKVRAYDEENDSRILVFVLAGSVEEAIKASNEWQVDGLVVQGEFLPCTNFTLCSSYVTII